MAETMLSVGIDIGTSTTQLIFSRLTVENRANSFTVPDLAISRREILYRSPIHFTPLRSATQINAAALRDIVAEEYRRAEIDRGAVQTGAIIITGETARKENARAALESLSEFAGDFVVATAGPDLESLLAARGAGADIYSEKTGKTVLHMDIGGGTSNLSLIENGHIAATGCLNVGGRLVKVTQDNEISYLSPVLSGLCGLSIGQRVREADLNRAVELLVHALEQAAGMRPETELLAQLTTEHPMEIPKERPVISFSGGVADLIEDRDSPPFAYGDIGVLLGRAIRKSRLCKGPYILGKETIRATVIGAGCHSTQLSGSTVFYRGLRFPLRGLPVASMSAKEQGLPPADLAALVRDRLARYSRPEDQKPVVLSLPGVNAPRFADLCRLADGLAEGLEPALSAGFPAIITTEADMAKALGHALAFRLPEQVPIMCLDNLRLKDGDFLDIGAPVGSGAALPVVIKTLILPNERRQRNDTENQIIRQGLCLPGY